MGAHQSRTVKNKPKSAPKLNNKLQQSTKAKDKHVECSREATNSERHDLSLAQPKTDYGAMFPVSTPSGKVSREKRWECVYPFTILMRDWTNYAWPYDGSFETDKIELLCMNVNPLVGNPTWDYN